MRLTLDEFKEKLAEDISLFQIQDKYSDDITKDEVLKILNSENLYNLPLELFYNHEYKVNFDMENWEIFELGVTLTGIPYMAGWFGGDWEIPMVVIYYYDKTGKLTNYIPTKGNSFNRYTMTAFGSEKESDKFDSLVKKYNLENEEYPEEALITKVLELEGYPGIYIDSPEYDYIDYNMEMILEDFQAIVKLK